MKAIGFPMPKPKMPNIPPFNKRGLKNRWMFSGTLIVFCVVVLCVFAFAFVIRSYYYSAVRSGLEAKAQTASTFFTTYVSKTYAEYYQSAYKYTQSFDEKDKLELQFINIRGRVEISSNGITAGNFPNTPDITGAISNGRITPWTGTRSSTGEKIMSVSAPLFYSDGSVVGIMRYVTSMKLVSRQIGLSIAAAVGIGLLVIAIVILSNLYFIRTITEPIKELTGMARRIADGSYGIRAEKQHDDEIGDLIDSINDMSAKIGQAEAVQTEFISQVSHELRTPLTAITGWSETMMYDTSISGDSRRGLEIISREANRLTKMVEELLEFTRMQDGRFNLNLEVIDVSEQLEESLSTYSELLRREDIKLVYNMSEDDLPHIFGDPERLKQVFLNILDNAAKYGHDGKLIIVGTSHDSSWITISIRDFGRGIPEDELPHVKEKFYKGSSKERGSGIGLAVCDEIISRHNGKFIIENASDGAGGVTVTVKLPAASETEYKI